MQLLVDLGNTRLKWACRPGDWRPATLVHGGRDMAGALAEAWGGLAAPRAVLAVSVAAASARAAFEQWVGARWGVEVRYARPLPQQCGVRNRYLDPGALGADRWAAVIGARAAIPAGNLAVIDCGTAVTVDALSASGDFLGGIIVPGIALQRQALLAGTGGIRAADGDESTALARSTGDAVAAGTLYAVLGAIERACGEFERALGAPFELVLTGGDALRIQAQLERSARHVPDLVLRGLARVAGDPVP